MTRQTQQEQLVILGDYLQKTMVTGGEEHLTFKPSTNSWSRNGKAVTMMSVARRLGVRFDIDRNRVLNLLEILSENLFDDMIDSLQGWVVGHEPRAQSECELRKFVTAIQRVDATPLQHECHVWAFKQWIWQVKRHIMHLPVTYPVMPILWSSEQGTGKSFNVLKLWAPLENFARHMSVDELGERFSNRMMAQTFIVFFDELAGIAEADSSQFKSFTTGRPFQGRSMHGESGFSGENRISCIATTNVGPPHGIDDASGARRLWSIHCSGVMHGDRAQRMAALDAVNHDEIWRCISYQHPDVHSLVPPEVREAMAAERKGRLTAHDSLDKFFDEYVTEHDDKVWPLPVREVQSAYRAYCRLYNRPALKLTQAMLSDRLRRRGFEVRNHSNVDTVKGLRLLTHESCGK